MVFNIMEDYNLIKSKFEKILQYKITADKPLSDIDSFIQVNDIYKMELVNEYLFIDIEEIKKKNNVFIYLENYYNKEYDFAILNPQEQNLILFKAEHKITNENIRNNEYYFFCYSFNFFDFFNQ